ncbi:ABC transporter ATP-binding protein [Dictyobacter arantiisoli]|uniref:ABC transporter ATP-binding protein n=1 Tax=Dictyobacter arantiisoli TaxID=2014874 RepID=A0A5A5TL22_9CHLR|nr:ABC transporter ATP-binding protein [Dictyobacter arantiisoli]GCF11644.1 ABC transporter ATP-binding protein [Dictyobacter arantiisoli]
MNDNTLRMQSRNTSAQALISNIAIEIENLTVNYGKNPVIKGLSLEVPVGSIYGFLGANGAGKTTTIKTLLGFRPPNSGRARVLGYDVVSQQREICRRVSYVSETNSLYEYLTISQLCHLCRDMQQHWNQEIVNRYIHTFELPLNKRVKYFSKGMKSQLALCLALGNDPDLLILDEPTTGLDPVARQVFLTTLVSDVAAAGKTIFFSSHILSEVEAIADHVAVLHHGSIVLNDEVDNLREMQKVLHLTYVEQPPAEELERLRRWPGVHLFEQEGRTVRLRIEGDVDALTKSIQARPYEPRNLEVVSVQLEDLLIEYIKGGGK